MATGNDFTSYEIINTYKTLLYASSTTPSSAIVNEGFTTNLKDIRSGDGTNSPLQISSDFVNINGSNKLMLDGTILTASASALNSLSSGTGTVTKITTGNDTVLFTEAGVTVSTASTSLTAVVNPTLSITNLFASTGIFIAGTSVPSAADIAAVSALTSVNTAAITSINNVTTSINTVVGAVSALTSVNTAAITSINGIVGTGGFATTTELASVNTSVVANTAAITSINTVIGAVSALTSVNKDAITSINSVTTSINTVVAAVSALTSVNKDAITSINTITTSINNVTTSINTVVGAVSALTSVNKAAITSINTVTGNLATSIANHLPLAGGTLTGGVSGTNLVLSGGLGLGTVTAFLGKKARMIGGAAIADLVTLTDGANIATDLNTGQNFVVTLGGNRTLDNPTNCVAGQVGSIFIVQDGTGSRTLAYGTSWDFPDGTAPTLSTSINSADRLDYIVFTSTDVQAILTKAYS